MLVCPLVGPEGAAGVLTLHGVLMTTVLADDIEEVTLVLVAHLACALTLYVPGEPHDFDALVDELQDEYVPSPHSKRYCTP
jgi:hypothetical protein